MEAIRSDILNKLLLYKKDELKRFINSRKEEDSIVELDEKQIKLSFVSTFSSMKKTC